MTRTDVLNFLITNRNYKSYLEIGVQTKVNFSRVTCDRKVCVDPDVQWDADYVMTSDEFFAQNKETFDLIFIDGLHEWQQVMADVNNSLAVLNEGGTILLHDCNPHDEKQQIVPRMQQDWTGDVWKTMVKLRQSGEVIAFTIADDCGCGVVRKGNQAKIVVEDELNWANFEKNKTEWLGLISSFEFMEREFGIQHDEQAQRQNTQTRI